MVLEIKKNKRDSKLKQEALEEVIKDEPTRTTLLVPKSLKDEMKIYTIKNNIPNVTDLIIRAVKEYMKNHK